MAEPTSSPAPAALLTAAESLFEEQAIGVLEDYTRIACLSPSFDADWQSHGYISAAASLLLEWVQSVPLRGLQAELITLPGLTPVLVAEVPATSGYTGDPYAMAALLYGHMDKQPPLGQWREGLDPYVPVRKGDALYGRGIADDGYAVFSAVGALCALETNGLDHGRCLVLIEATEESGSPHLGPYLELLDTRLGENGPALVVCLDSGSPTYDRFWCTTSLRGLLQLEIRVDVLTEGIHSGAGGGVVPSSFRLLRQLLDRIEDPATGEVLAEACNVEIPPVRRREADMLVETLSAAGDGGNDRFPAVPGLVLGGEPGADRVLARTWRPSVALVGADGLPSSVDGGNVLRPYTAVSIAMRLPPSADPDAVEAQITALLLADPPAGAQVTVKAEGAAGFDAPSMDAWLSAAVDEASVAYFGAPAGYAGEGGTIPFLSTLQSKYPISQFLVTGVLGPGSNAHGPNEMLHIPTAKAVTAAVAHVLSVQP